MVGSEGHDNFEFSRSPSGWEIITYFQCISQKKKNPKKQVFSLESLLSNLFQPRTFHRSQCRS